MNGYCSQQKQHRWSVALTDLISCLPAEKKIQIRKQSDFTLICYCYQTNMPKFYMAAFFHKDGGIIKQPRQEKFKLELKSLIEKKRDIKMSLSKLRILIIALSERLKEFVGRTFCKEKIKLRKPINQMIKTDVRRFFNTSDPSNSKQHLY